MTPGAQNEGRARCPQRAALARTLPEMCITPNAGRARRSARAVAEARDARFTHRSLTLHLSTIAVAFTLALLTACATANKPTAEAPQRKFKVLIATNDAPLAAPWQIPAGQVQTQTPLQTSATPIPAKMTLNANQSTQTPAPTPTPPPRARILPLTARIASVNEKLRFVVVDFTNSRQPGMDEKLGVYRVGEKVAEIKVSGPYRNTTVAADIVAGEVKYGDEVKPD
jgi:hypothetical protein